MTDTLYVTTAIPYVNAPPHLGHALELVEADALARHWRRRGWAVRSLTGTDDNALKNVRAAEALGIPTGELVARNAARFDALRPALGLSFDDVIHTSSDPRHAPAVERIWRACAAAGDLYRRHYEGLYCVGCEEFKNPADLEGGRCREHDVAPDEVAEENWFFRLSRYEGQLHDLVASGRLRVEPDGRRREVLAFIEAGLEDFSVSRSAARAKGWGIAVPDDPTQVVYVWFDALVNYISALGYGLDAPEYREWWVESDERVHVVGKGILRFHAVAWPAILLSAGEPVPTAVFVHDYLTVEGRKLSKSSGDAVDAVQLVEQFGTDAVRHWLLREVPRTGDADFTVDRLVGAANRDLANGVGNLVSRTLGLVRRYRPGGVTPTPGPVAGRAAAELDAAFARFDLRGAAGRAFDLVGAGNRLVEESAPWELARSAAAGDDSAARALDRVLDRLLTLCVEVAELLEPFAPALAARVAAAIAAAGGRDVSVEGVFARIEV